MTNERWASLLFWVAAAYDGILGAVFLVAAPRMFAWFEVTPPNHYGYVHFPAALLIVFAIMFAAVATNPVRNRNLIPYGVLLKASYCGTVFSYWIGGGIPYLWKPFAVCDAVFGVLFLWAYAALGTRRGTEPTSGTSA
jgi:hypothetical protein